MTNRRPEISECLLPAETRNKTTEESLGELEDGAHMEKVQFSNPELGLRRRLSLLDGISLLVGIIIGSGIFTSPGVVLLDAGSVGLGLTAWVAAAFMAMCSALVYAELGAALPQAGGNAEFFRVAFGDAYAFSFIWTMFFVLTNASLAIGAVTFSRYIVAGVSTQYSPPLPTSITLIVIWYEAETFLRMPFFQFPEVQAESVSVPYTKLKMINQT